uniref:Beta_helix domain-containing protein n=1 Tax=Gongylonema pulchrum TaxID=637853 RepID=A0A183ELI1_9BILA
LYDRSELSGHGRPDSITIYSDAQFTQTLHRFTSQTIDWSANVQTQSLLSVHMRASAANGDFGFVAEIIVIPSFAQPKVVEEVLIRQSRIKQNDRGAVLYRNSGGIGPSITVSECEVQNNGYHLFGNISTTTRSIEMHLFNTLMVQFRNSLLTHNMGGLWLTALTANSVARLIVVIRECAFMHNSNGTVLAFLGSGNQKLWLFNNLITNNYALYQDTVLLKDITANMTRNLFANNTGLHSVDFRPGSSLSADSYSLHKNWFHDNTALGHGHQYQVHVICSTCDSEVLIQKFHFIVVVSQHFFPFRDITK